MNRFEWLLTAVVWTLAFAVFAYFRRRASTSQETEPVRQSKKIER